MSDEKPAEEAPDFNDGFWDKVGEDHDPKKFFIKQVTKCGGKVTETDDGFLEVEGGCGNLVCHMAASFKEVFCTECGISVAVDEIFDLEDGADLSEKTSETSSDEQTGDSGSSDLDEFLDKID